MLARPSPATPQKKRMRLLCRRGGLDRITPRRRSIAGGIYAPPLRGPCGCKVPTGSAIAGEVMMERAGRHLRKCHPSRGDREVFDHPASVRDGIRPATGRRAFGVRTEHDFCVHNSLFYLKCQSFPLLQFPLLLWCAPAESKCSFVHIRVRERMSPAALQ
jgi:hypothetical protein